MCLMIEGDCWLGGHIGRQRHRAHLYRIVRAVTTTCDHEEVLLKDKQNWHCFVFERRLALKALCSFQLLILLSPYLECWDDGARTACGAEGSLPMISMALCVKTLIATKNDKEFDPMG